MWEVKDLWGEANLVLGGWWGVGCVLFYGLWKVRAKQLDGQGNKVMNYQWFVIQVSNKG